MFDLEQMRRKHPGVPEHTLYSLDSYLNHKLPPGGFLTAVLTNDLFGAIGKADGENSRAIKEICMLIYNDIPSGAWGTKEKVERWLS